MFNPSKFQQTIYDEIGRGSANIIVNAVAGSGKTTTIVNALGRIPSEKSVLFLAFNKSIVSELKTRTVMHENVEVRTLHSLGCRSIMRTGKVRINANKYKTFLNAGLQAGSFAPNKELRAEQARTYKSNIIKLIDLIRVNLCRSYEQAADIVEKHGIELVDNELKIVSRAIKWGRKHVAEIDFCDMIYFPCVKEDIRVDTYDYVFIDECQDLNTAQRALFLRTVKPGGRFCAVGDPQQAIYGFAGADVESFRQLTQLPNTKVLPLSVCYRCAKSIIAQAQTIVPHIEPFEKSEEGVIEYDLYLNDVRDGDMVLCRNTAPLVQACIRYLLGGVKAYIKGRDIGANLVETVRRTERNSIVEVLKSLDRELAKLVALIQEKNNCSVEEAKETSRYTVFEDKVEALAILSEGLKSAQELIDRIDSIFSDNTCSGIQLSTIHKSKGLEASRVFILKEDLLFPKWANKRDWMKEQEANLAYVAYTRAKKYLGYIDSTKLLTSKQHEVVKADREKANRKREEGQQQIAAPAPRAKDPSTATEGIVRYTDFITSK